jgi:hypothetical protein
MAFFKQELNSWHLQTQPLVTLSLDVKGDLDMPLLCDNVFCDFLQQSNTEGSKEHEGQKQADRQ